MTIALIILHANPSRGGAERYTADLAAALASRGHTIHLLATDFGPSIPNVNFVELKSPGLTRSAQYNSFLNSLEIQLNQIQYDIIHAMLPVPRCDLYHPHAGLAALSRNQLLNPRRRRFANIERQLLSSKNPPIVLCLSDYVKSAISTHYQLPPDRLATLFNAVDLARFVPADAPNNQDITTLMIAQDFQRKGLKEAIDALAQIKNPQLKLRVVGKPDPTKYRRQAAQLGIADCITFAGPTDNPRAEYAAADFFILPTRHDPCSLVVLEALAMGLPVISTKFNGACEIMQDGVHGYVLQNPRNVYALALALHNLLDPATRARMREQCLKLRPALSFDTHVDRLLSIYQGVKR